MPTDEEEQFTTGMDAMHFLAEATPYGVVLKINDQEWAKGNDKELFTREPLTLLKPLGEFVLGVRGEFDIVRDRPYYQFSVATGIDVSTYFFYLEKNSFFYPKMLSLAGDVIITDLLIL